MPRIELSGSALRASRIQRAVLAGLSTGVCLLGACGGPETLSLDPLSVSPAVVNFGPVALGSTATRVVTVTNASSAALVLTGLTLANAPGVSQSGDCGTALAGKASCSLRFVYQPSSPAVLAGTATFQGAAEDGIAIPKTLTLTAQGYPAVASLTHFGDSITCGYYATPNDGQGAVYSDEGYAGVMDAAMAQTGANHCRAGDQAADVARFQVYPYAMPELGARQLYTLMVGTNDANYCGNDPGCLSNYQNALRGSLAWLAMPASDKVLASSIAGRVGYWGSDPVFSMGLSAAGPDRALTFTVQQTVADRGLYVGYRVFDLAHTLVGAATVVVDGETMATLDANPDSGHVLLTANGTNDTVFVTRIPLGAVGTHTVRVTTTSVPSASFSLLWAGVSSGNYAQVDGAPRLLVGGPPASTKPVIAVNLPTYNNLVSGVVQELTGDGMNVTLVPTSTTLATDTDLYKDHIHPNNSGHAKLAEAFENALP